MLSLALATSAPRPASFSFTAGVLIADYFIVRRKKLNVRDLYVRHGEYEFTRGFNIRALLALACGVAVALIGLFVDPLRPLYDYAWFVGFAVAFIVYPILMAGTKRV